MAKESICEIDFLSKKPEKTGYSGFHRTIQHRVCLYQVLSLSKGCVRVFGMVNKSTKERGKKGKQVSMAEEKPPTEEVRQPSAEETKESSAGEETALQPEVIEEEKAHGVDESAHETATEEKANAEKPAKKSRGRPKKTDSSEPAVKKAKTGKKERSRPERTSTRVANQRAGIKLQKTEELPAERKRSPTKRASKDNELTTVSEQNGAAVEVA